MFSNVIITINSFFVLRKKIKKKNNTKSQNKLFSTSENIDISNILTR